MRNLTHLPELQRVDLTPAATMPTLACAQRERRALKTAMAHVAQLAADAVRTQYGGDAVSWFCGEIEGVSNNGREFRYHVPANGSTSSMEDAISAYDDLMSAYFGTEGGSARMSVVRSEGRVWSVKIDRDTPHPWDDFPAVLVLRDDRERYPKGRRAAPPRGYVAQICGGVR